MIRFEYPIKTDNQSWRSIQETNDHLQKSNLDANYNRRKNPAER